MKHKSKSSKKSDKSSSHVAKIKNLLAPTVRMQAMHDADIQEFADYEMDLRYRAWIKNQVLIVTIVVLTVVALIGYLSQDRSVLFSANVLEAGRQDQTQMSSLDQQDVQENLPIEDPMQFHQ